MSNKTRKFEFVRAIEKSIADVVIQGDMDGKNYITLLDQDSYQSIYVQQQI